VGASRSRGNHQTYPNRHYLPHPTLPGTARPVDQERDRLLQPCVKQKRNDDGTIQYRVRGTAGGNLLQVPYDVSAKTAGLLDTVKLLIHSVISGDFKWLTIDIADFYLSTPLPASRYEYLRIHVDKLPPAIIAQYNLNPLIYNKHVYFEIRKCMYDIPQAGKLSQTRLIQHLKENGYTQCPNTPCLFRHHTREIMFCLVVDDFGVRYKIQAGARRPPDPYT
jgi:hypothetical protein